MKPLALPRPRWTLLTAILVLAACWPQTAGAQGVAGALDGEHLGGSGFITEGIDGDPSAGGEPQDCDPSGTSTVRFRVSGTATGPYPGVFTETGTATIGAQTTANDAVTGTALAGPVLTFTAQFEITSGSTIIRGTKTLTANHLGTPWINYGACASFEDSANLAGYGPEHGYATISGRTYAVDVASTYEATITTATGTIHDSGEARTYFEENYLTGGTCVDPAAFCNIAGSAAASGLNENFSSPAPETPIPACSNGLDDDGDDLYDFGEDPGCTSPTDDDETDPPPPPPPSDDKNASKRCKAEREANPAAFDMRYRNHGDCVSQSPKPKR